MKLKDFRELTKNLPEDTEILGLNYDRNYDAGEATINTVIHYPKTKCTRQYFARDSDGVLEIGNSGKRVKAIFVSAPHAYYKY